MVFSVLSRICLLNRWKTTLTQLWAYSTWETGTLHNLLKHIDEKKVRKGLEEESHHPKHILKTTIAGQSGLINPFWTWQYNDIKEFGIIHVHCPKTTGFLCAHHCYMTCVKHSFKTEYMDKFALDKQNSLVHIIDNIKKIISHCLHMQEKKRILSLFNNVNLYHIMKQNL